MRFREGRDYDSYDTKITLGAYRGNAGWPLLKLVSVEALGNQEQHLLVATSFTGDGVALTEDDPEKLLRLSATTRAARLFNHMSDSTLVAKVATSKTCRNSMRGQTI